MLKIYGADLSAPANKVRMTANALGLKYEYIQMNIRAGGTRTEQYLKIHPAGKVPAIDDNGFILFESDAIVKYLAASKKSSLYPEGLKQRAYVDQWMDFVAIHVGGAMSKVLFNRVFASFAKVPVDERSLSDGIKFLERFLPVVDQQLAKDRYIAGENFSLADIALLATIDPAGVAGIDLAPYKHISAWYNMLRQKDFYTQCHPSYDAVLKKVMSGAA
jgi:glutathione S-transferase